jgi:hypothetical protein
MTETSLSPTSRERALPASLSSFGAVYWIVLILSLAYKNKQLSKIARFAGE